MESQKQNYKPSAVRMFIYIRLKRQRNPMVRSNLALFEESNSVHVLVTHLWSKKLKSKQTLTLEIKLRRGQISKSQSASVDRRSVIAER